MSVPALDCQQDPEESRKKRDLDALKAHANQLAEQFDTVQIIATRQDGGKTGTIHAAHGMGNWYARYGSVRAWLVNEDGQLQGNGE